MSGPRRTPADRADQEVAADQVIAAVRIGLLGVVVVLQATLALRPLLAHGYPHHGIAVAAYTAVACVTAGCAAWVLRRRPVPVPVVIAGTAVALGADVAATAALPGGQRFGAADWAFGLIGWHLLLLLLDRLPVLLTVLGAHIAIAVVPFALGGPDRFELGTAGTVVVGTAVVQTAAAVIAHLVAARARGAMALAAERDRLAIRVTTAEAFEQGRRTAFAGHLGATLSLLADLADGLLDPRRAQTRRWAALAATQLRRLFAENDDVPDPLVHELSACLDVAARRGVEVALAVSGAAVDVPPEVRSALTAPVAAALAGTGTRARVSVLRADGDVRVAVIGDGLGYGAEHGAPPGVEIESGRYGEYARVEARWRRQHT